VQLLNLDYVPSAHLQLPKHALMSDTEEEAKTLRAGRARATLRAVNLGCSHMFDN